MPTSMELIECNPKILSGKPVIKGTRVSVAYVLQCIASGMTVDEILRGHPHLTREGVMAALDYAARQMQGEEIHVVGVER